MNFMKLFEPVYKTTTYEREVLAELQIGEYIKAYYKRLATTAISIAVVAVVWVQISKNQLTADLVKHAGLTPLQAYFANNFESEKIILNKKREDLTVKMESLNTNTDNGVGDFLKQKAKSPEFMLSLQNDITQSPRFIDYLGALYVQQDKEFVINSAAYKMSDLVSRAKLIAQDKELSPDEKKELIEKIQKAIITGWNHPVNEATLSASMHSLFNFDRKSYYPQSKSYADPSAKFDEANYDLIMQGFVLAALESRVSWNGITLPPQNYQTAYLTLKKAFVENSEMLRQMQEKQKEDRQKVLIELNKVNDALASVAGINAHNYTKTAKKIEEVIKELR